jgi:hypothetical protein
MEEIFKGINSPIKEEEEINMEDIFKYNDKDA